MNNPIADDKRKLIIALSLLLSLGFIVTSFTSYFVSRNAIRQSILEDELPLTADNIYSEIQKDLVRPTFISSMMASDTFLRDWILDGERDVTQISKYLQEVKNRYGAFASFFISERTRNYYYAKGILKQISQTDAHDVWYYRVRAMTQAYEISVDTDQAHRNALTIFINFRVFDYENRFLGVAGIGLTVDAVRKLVDSYQQRYKRNIYFVDRRGEIMLHSGKLADSNIRRIPGLQAQADRILRNEATSLQYQLDARTHLLNVRFIPELDWFLFVERLEEDATAEIRRTLYINLAICLIITAGVLLATNLVLNRYQRRLEEMATTDKLTGLGNRQACELVAEQAVRLSQRRATALSAVIIDIDRFKEINDRYGHLIGDDVIRSVARAIKGCLREADFICRWGGEEYLLLLQDCDLANAQRIAEHIRATVTQATYVHGSISFTVTVSLGVAEYLAPESADNLFSRADTALYQAKQSGRDRVCPASAAGAVRLALAPGIPLP